MEIACPADCGYLAASQAHPAAVVRRQQERDVGFLMAMQEGLSARATELFWVTLTFLAGVKADPLVRLQDEDLAEACGSLAATYETADRGLIYEHRPQALAAQRLATDLKAFLATLLQDADATATRAVERDATAVFRHLEKGAREAARVLGDGPDAALTIIERVGRAARQESQAGGPSSRIEPPTPMLVKP